MDETVRRRLFRASRPIARFGGSARQFFWLLRHVRTFDQVQTHSIFTISAVYAILICAVQRVPIVLWPHGSLDPYDLRKHRWFKKVVGPLVTRRLLDRCAVLVFTAPHEAKVAVTYGSHVPREVVPLPVRPLPQWHEDRDQWLARFGVPAGVPVVLFFGRIDYKKRVPLLVEALSLLEHKNAHLLVVGDGLDSQRQLLAEAVERCGLGDRVHVAGWVEGGDRAAAFANANVFALLSDFENFGLSVVEALSVGCPVVISDQLALAQDLAAVGAAAVVERDARQAAQAMDAILSNPTAAAEMGARAKDFVVREFSPEAIAHRLRRLGSSTDPV
jgi:glycosyltransferase involved in cell wall biosynthesis